MDKISKRDQIVVADPKDALRAVAMDIGKQVAFHIESMYPDAVKAASSTFLLSVRNSVHNEIIAAIESDENFAKRIAGHDYQRRFIRKLRKMGDEAESHRKQAQK